MTEQGSIYDDPEQQYTEREKIHQPEGEIRALIELAMTHAIPEENFDNISDARANLVRQFMGHVITASEFREGLSELEKEDEGIVFFEDLPSFVEGLRATWLSQDEIDAYALHESSHFNVALDQGLKAVPFIQFLTKGSSMLGLIPGVRTSWPAGMDEDLKRQAMYEIGNAPETLSENDKNALGL